MAGTPRGTRHLSRPRRSWPQRLLLGIGCLVTVATLSGAAVVGWGAWKLGSIDRTDVSLDQLIEDGPTNYLLVGSDSRTKGDPDNPGATADHLPLADTVMVLRVDPSTTSAKVLSLPRDLWVTVASTGEEGRINAAYAAGPQPLIDTIRAELDIPIHHYVEVDFQGFQKIVDTVGGIHLWFDTPMRDLNSGLDVQSAGCTVLDGRGALAFARSRKLRYLDEDEGRFVYDGTGDLGRITRQQVFLRQVITEVKGEGLHDPLTLKRLVDVGTDNVTIDDELPVGDLLALSRRYADFDPADLETFTLPTYPRTTSGGAAIVEIQESEAAPVLEEFRDEEPAAPAGDEPVLEPTEVDLTVLNSAGVSGLAGEVAVELGAAGFTIDGMGNGEELGHPAEASTTVRYAPGAEAKARTVAAHVEGGAEVEADAGLAEGAVVMFLGADFTGLVDATSGGSTGGSESTGATASSEATAAVERTDRATDASAASTPTTTEAVGVAPDGEPPAGQTCG